MCAYITVDPTKLNPRRLRSLLNASDSRVLAGIWRTVVHRQPARIERALQGMAAHRPVAEEIGTAGRLLSDHFDRLSADFDE